MGSVQSAQAYKQPESFEFSAENAKKAKAIVAKYPDGRQQSAALPLLDLAQRQCGGWLPRVAIEGVANYLGVPVMRMLEVASFYSMFNLTPVGKHFIQVCRTTPCWLRGSDQLVDACRNKLGIDLKQTTPDGKFTLVEVECLGACANAPMVQINDDYYEDLSPSSMEQLIDHLSKGKVPATGSQIGRKASEPEGSRQSSVVKNGASRPKASSPQADASTSTVQPIWEETMVTLKKPAAKKPAAKKPAAKKTAVKKPAAKKTAVKKPAAKKAVKKVAAKKPAAKKVAAKKPAAKKKVAAKKPAAKK